MTDTLNPTPTSRPRTTGKGFLESDAYVAADQIDRVQDGAVHLTVADKEMLKEADT